MHHVEADVPVLGVVEGLGNRSDDGEPELLPEVYGGLVRLDDRVELDRPKALRTAQSIMSSQSSRPTPLPRAAESTMKLALATCDPGPGRFGYMFALPRTVPSASIATVVRLSGSAEGDIQSARPCSSVRSGS